MGCNSFETLQSYNGSRIMQNSDKKNSSTEFFTILTPLTTGNTLAPSTQVTFFHCG